MARGSIMLQLQVVDFYAPNVSSIPALDALALDFLDRDKTTVREVAVEKIEGLASASSGIANTPPNAFARLRLFFRDGPKRPKIFLAPSHVPSPQFQGAGVVVLDVLDFGYENVKSFQRLVGAHAYLDEVV